MIPPDNPVHSATPDSTDIPAGIPAENREAATQLGLTMKRLHRHISSRVMSGMQDELQELDLSFSQMTALHQLRAQASMTVTGLSEQTRLSLPAASHLVERLVQRKLAARQENPENRREKMVALTEAGRAVLSQMDAAFVNAYIGAFARLNPQTIHAAEVSMKALLRELEPVTETESTQFDNTETPPPTFTPQEKP